MAIEISLTGYPSGATDVYAYYVGQSLASYVADKVLFVEGTGPDTGLYTATVDETKGTSIVAFVGAAQPASWAEALVGVSWDLSGAISVALAEADQIIEEEDGVQVLRTYRRGTSTELLPAKAAKQPGGAALTDPTTERLAGYRE